MANNNKNAEETLKKIYGDDYSPQQDDLTQSDNMTTDDNLNQEDVDPNIHKLMTSKIFVGAVIGLVALVIIFIIYEFISTSALIHKANNAVDRNNSAVSESVKQNTINDIISL